eukprot:956014-Prorocentrum_minimum.AAC.1
MRLGFPTWSAYTGRETSEAMPRAAMQRCIFSSRRSGAMMSGGTPAADRDRPTCRPPDSQLDGDRSQRPQSVRQSARRSLQPDTH